jgi:hypothetical protein
MIQLFPLFFANSLKLSWNDPRHLESKSALHKKILNRRREIEAQSKVDAAQKSSPQNPRSSHRMSASAFGLDQRDTSRDIPYRVSPRLSSIFPDIPGQGAQQPPAPPVAPRPRVEQRPSQAQLEPPRVRLEPAPREHRSPNL